MDGGKIEERIDEKTEKDIETTCVCQLTGTTNPGWDQIREPGKKEQTTA